MKKTISLPEEIYWKLMDYRVKGRFRNWEEFFSFVLKIMEGVDLGKKTSSKD